MNQEETTLVKKFVRTQFRNSRRKDWCKTVLDNLQHLEIGLSIEGIEKMPKKTYIDLIKRKIK